jgi:hypothetical protein
VRALLIFAVWVVTASFNQEVHSQPHPLETMQEYCRRAEDPGRCTNPRRQTYQALTIPRWPDEAVGRCDEADLLDNMRWLHANNDWAAFVIAYGDSGGDVAMIRRAFRWGQRHRPDIANRFDGCSDLAWRSVAERFADEALRIGQCGAPTRARSVTCADLRENIRWAAQDSGPCAAMARTAIISASRAGNARALRRAVQYAQGHNEHVFRSVEYVAGPLLLEIATAVIREHGLIPSPRPVSLAPNIAAPGCGVLPLREQREAPFVS